MEQIIKAHKKLNEATIQLERAIRAGKLLNIDRDIILTKIAKAYDSIQRYNTIQPMAEPVSITTPKVETPASVKTEVRVEPVVAKVQPKQVEICNTEVHIQTPKVEPEPAPEIEVVVEPTPMPEPIKPTKPTEPTITPIIQQNGTTINNPTTKERAKSEKAKADAKSSTEILSDKFKDNQRLINEQIGEHSTRLDVATKLQNRPISDLSKAIGINDKFLYIKELFNGNADIYANTLKTLNQFTDLNDAIIYIHQNFEWSNDNESATRFIDLVRRKFI